MKIDKETELNENNIKSIIKSIRILEVLIGLILILVISIIGIILYSNDYFKTDNVGYGIGNICYFNGEIKNYLIMEDNEGKMYYDFDDDIIKENFDINNYTDANTLLNEIVKYIKENNGSCLSY